MGYTHYYPQVRDITDDEWLVIMTLARMIFTAEDVALAGPMGDKGTKPEVTLDYISFNGVGPDSHETCYIPRIRTDWEEEDQFRFCKTAEKPYDRTVVAVLKMVNRNAKGAFHLSSDGGESVFK